MNEHLSETTCVPGSPARRPGWGGFSARHLRKIWQPDLSFIKKALRIIQVRCSRKSLLQKSSVRLEVGTAHRCDADEIIQCSLTPVTNA
jgi:hypothetical protein